jgi:hypothetical protein
MSQVIGRGSIMLSFAVVAVSMMAVAEDRPVRVRGTLERMDGDICVIKAHGGDTLQVKLADKPMVVALTKASLADIKPGSYIGVSGMPQPDGSQKALEVHIFPESMRGAGDGHRPWDLQPSSTMTNGSVAQSGASSAGEVISLKYKDGEKKIVVPSDAPIVAYTPTDKSELRPGARVFIAAAIKLPDGTLQASRINVGRGVNPPM